MLRSLSGTEYKVSKLRWGFLSSVFDFNYPPLRVLLEFGDYWEKVGIIDRKNVCHLVGESNIDYPRVFKNKIFWSGNEDNQFIRSCFRKNLTKKDIERMDRAVSFGAKIIREFVQANNVDILLGCDSLNSENILLMLCIGRYYMEESMAKRKAPYYIVWAKDSAKDEGINMKTISESFSDFLLKNFWPNSIDYIFFSNGLKFDEYKESFKLMDKVCPGFYRRMKENHFVLSIIPDLDIKKISDLEKGFVSKKTLKFVKDYNLVDLFESNGVSFSRVLFCLESCSGKEKDLEFSLKYFYEVLKRAKSKDLYDAGYLFIRDSSSIKERKKNDSINKALSKKYGGLKIIIDYVDCSKTSLIGRDYASIFSLLRGFSLNVCNCIESPRVFLRNIAAGLPLVFRENDIYLKDLKRFDFDVISFSNKKILRSHVDSIVEILEDSSIRKKNMENNIKIMEKYCSPERVLEVLERIVK